MASEEEQMKTMWNTLCAEPIGRGQVKCTDEIDLLFEKGDVTTKTSFLDEKRGIPLSYDR